MPRGRDRDPRNFSEALRALRSEVAPQTRLAAAQAAWPEAVGELVARHSEPVAERDGVLHVACESATWAQELDLMQDDLLARLKATLGPAREAQEETIQRLRFSADAARHRDF